MMSGNVGIDLKLAEVLVSELPNYICAHAKHLMQKFRMNLRSLSRQRHHEM
jgi:hypothetical protein